MQIPFQNQTKNSLELINIPKIDFTTDKKPEMLFKIKSSTKKQQQCSVKVEEIQEKNCKY